eukprot:CAMPEP_0174853460 /NCGR_PEP_ID=MMETSP1114-20130205/28566_1 /TAXON_ID=312471 /ORGANISM="Neobodo designis, Strain CCAP 1951/1" /LENGTH=45 /DNA_ID= /DNA_START= /DNA_END= /DNA_ORIENTATION=
MSNWEDPTKPREGNDCAYPGLQEGGFPSAEPASPYPGMQGSPVMG